MIQARQLRLGNWIDTPHGKGYIAHVKDLLDCRNYEPIVLTSEVLLQCGFEKSEYNEQEQWLSPVIIRHNPYSEYRIGLMARPFGYTYEEAVVKIIVNYLHQLQNLFFCLTGEELNITL